MTSQDGDVRNKDARLIPRVGGCVVYFGGPVMQGSKPRSNANIRESADRS